MADKIPNPDPDKQPAPRRERIAVMVAEMWRAGGRNRNRIVIWVVVAGFGVYLIVTGIVGEITKAR
jgi:hypothetical protein